MNNYPFKYFIGQKALISNWILEMIDCPYKSVLDLFGGSGLMSQAFRSEGKEVIYNDVMKCFQFMNCGLLRSTKRDRLIISSLESLWNSHNKNQSTFVYDHYSKIYFFEDECTWIDKVISNILGGDYDLHIKGLLFFALAQSCLRKQPLNRFHKSFIKLRKKKRTNTQNWDIPFKDSFIENIHELNTYLETIDVSIKSIPIFEIPASEAQPSSFSKNEIDLVYLDPPFISGKKGSSKLGNYFINYHFLEALINFRSFSEWIDNSHSLKYPKQNHPIMKELNKWSNKYDFLKNFEKIISKFQESHIVLSFRDDSYITVDELVEILYSYKTQTKVFKKPHIYEQSGKKPKFNDILIISTD